MSQTSATRAVAVATLTGTVSFVWSQILWPWIVPAVAPVVTILLGLLQGLPLMHIWVGALVAFAASTVGMLRLEEYRARRRVENKLVFGQARFVKHIRDGGYGLGVMVSNRADFPIEFEVAELRTQLGDRVPSRRQAVARRIVVQPGGFGWWDDATITIAPPAPGTLTGEMEFRLRYGRPGFLKYELSGRKQIVVQFNDAGQPTVAAWNDVTA